MFRTTKNARSLAQFFYDGISWMLNYKKSTAILVILLMKYEIMQTVTSAEVVQHSDLTPPRRSFISTECGTFETVDNIPATDQYCFSWETMNLCQSTDHIAEAAKKAGNGFVLGMSSKNLCQEFRHQYPQQYTASLAAIEAEKLLVRPAAEPEFWSLSCGLFEVKSKKSKRGKCYTYSRMPNRLLCQSSQEQLVSAKSVVASGDKKYTDFCDELKNQQQVKHKNKFKELISNATQHLPLQTKKQLKELLIRSVKHDAQLKKMLVFALDYGITITVSNNENNWRLWQYSQNDKQLLFYTDYLSILRKLTIEQAVVSFNKVMRQALMLAAELEALDDHYSQTGSRIWEIFKTFITFDASFLLHSTILSDPYSILDPLKPLNDLIVDPIDTKLLAYNKLASLVYNAVTCVQTTLNINTAALDRLAITIQNNTYKHGQYFHVPAPPNPSFRSATEFMEDTVLPNMGIGLTNAHNMTYYYLKVLAKQDTKYLSTITFNPFFAESIFNKAIKKAKSSTISEEWVSKTKNIIRLSFKPDELAFWKALTRKQQEILDTLFLLKLELISSIRGVESCIDQLKICILSNTLNCLDHYLKCEYNDAKLSYQQTSIRMISTLYGSLNNISLAHHTLQELCDTPPQPSLETLLNSSDKDDGISSFSYSFLYLFCKTLADIAIEKLSVSSVRKLTLKHTGTLVLLILMGSDLSSVLLRQVIANLALAIKPFPEAEHIPLIDLFMAWSCFTGGESIKGFMKSAIGSGIGFYAAKKLIPVHEPAHENHARLEQH